MGHLPRFLRGKHKQDKKMYCIKEQTKSRYSSLSSTIVSLQAFEEKVETLWGFGGALFAKENVHRL
jgi:hypothetical protein